AYCANRAKTLQGNYDRGMTFGSDFTYATTGYTCDCSGARAEREFLLEEYELKKKHVEELRSLRKHYTEDLKVNRDKLLERKVEYDSLKSEDELFEFKPGKIK